MTKRKIPTVRIASPAGRPIQLRYICPVENREIRISTKTRDEAEADRQKKELEARLLLGIDARPRKMAKGPQMLWADFRESYTQLKVSTFRNEETMTSTDIRIDICQSIINPRTLREMASEDTLALLQAKLLAGGRSSHTVKSYMRTLIAALNWAFRPMRWIPERIAFKLLDVDEPDKGRPITTEEFERMLASCGKVCKVDPDSWKYLLRGSWESGLRLNEAMHLSWDVDGTIIPVWPRRGHPYRRAIHRDASDITISKAAKLVKAVPSKRDQTRLLEKGKDAIDGAIKTPRKSLDLFDKLHAAIQAIAKEWPDDSESLAACVRRLADDVDSGRIMEELE
jgi:integrase